MSEHQRYQLCILILTGAALGHQLLQKGFGISIPLLHAYLDDVLAMPIFLAIWRWERKQWWQISTLRKRDILLFIIAIFCLFEIILPHHSKAYTADWYDGLAYGLGGVLFWWLQPAQN